MFEKASRLKLRFTYRGMLSVEDLWDLSLEALDEIYRQLNRQSQELSGASLLDERDTEENILDLQLELVKYIFATKRAEIEYHKNAAERKARKEKLLEIIADKQDQHLLEMDVDELMRMVTELD